MPDKRILNLVGFAVCVGLMGFALYSEHVLGFEPCPLCVFQRIAVIALGVVFLAAAVHNASGGSRFVYAGLAGLVALCGAGVAGWHVRLQNLPADEVPACGPDLSYMLNNFPLTDVLTMVFTGSGDCAEIDWSLLGLSMPGWVLLFMVALGAAAVWNNLRTAAPA